VFRNLRSQPWSGQAQGLTYQRAIGALENYGHYAEVTLLGQKWIETLERCGRFVQQFDPFTGAPALSKQDGYGPTLLAMLEYLSRMHGVSLDVVNGQVWWSALADGKDFTYTQRWGDRTWTLTSEKGIFRARLNDRELFSCTAGVRVVTDLDGKNCQVVGIDSKPQSGSVQMGGQRIEFSVAPNQVLRLDGKKFQVASAVPFDYPFHKK